MRGWGSGLPDIPSTPMVVLGVDAAWTDTNPSGVAVVNFDGNRWSCCGVAPSYQQFVGIAAGQLVDWTRRPVPGRVDAAALLSAATALAGQAIDVVAVDMPLAFARINGRRSADNAISRLFGTAGAAVHSPTLSVPGEVSERFRDDFARLGFRLTTNPAVPPATPALIETYPHPIVMWLCDTCRRAPYKARNGSKYWPALSPIDRRLRLIRIWQDIILGLSGWIDTIGLPHVDQFNLASGHAMKAFEDGVDALVCAIAGITYLTGTAQAFGDENAAIWLPAACRDYAGRSDRFSASI